MLLSFLYPSIKTMLFFCLLLQYILATCVKYNSTDHKLLRSLLHHYRFSHPTNHHFDLSALCFTCPAHNSTLRWSAETHSRALCCVWSQYDSQAIRLWHQASLVGRVIELQLRLCQRSNSVVLLSVGKQMMSYFWDNGCALNVGCQFNSNDK